MTGLIPAAENAVGGSALRPGDVVTHYGGRTSEVLNTDAEGRLVLADAMAYALDKLDPAVLVDVATLTGTMKVALGQWTGGYFANGDDPGRRACAEAGAAAGEPLWRMPLEPDYEDTLTSQVADANNAPGGPGAITAALFLQHFAGDVPWAHLDIASTGDAPTDSFEWTKGPSGFGAAGPAHLADRPRPAGGHRLIGWLTVRPPCEQARCGLARTSRPPRRVGTSSLAHSFLATSSPSPTGSRTGTSVSLRGDLPAEVADGGGVLVALRRGRPPGRATARCRRPRSRRGAAGGGPP